MYPNRFHECDLLSGCVNSHHPELVCAEVGVKPTVDETMFLLVCACLCSLVYMALEGYLGRGLLEIVTVSDQLNRNSAKLIRLQSAS